MFENWSYLLIFVDKAKLTQRAFDRLSGKLDAKGIGKFYQAYIRKDAGEKSN